MAVIMPVYKFFIEKCDFPVPHLLKYTSPPTTKPVEIIGKINARKGRSLGGGVVDFDFAQDST